MDITIDSGSFTVDVDTVYESLMGLSIPSLVDFVMQLDDYVGDWNFTRELHVALSKELGFFIQPPTDIKVIFSQAGPLYQTYNG